MQLLRNARDAQGPADDLSEWKEISNMIYRLITHMHQVRFCLLRCGSAHWHYHSAILSSAASWRSSPPPCCAYSALDFSTRAVSHKTDLSSITLAFLGVHFLNPFLKLVFIPAPQCMYHEQHLLSSASPPMSLLSVCYQPHFLICMVTFSSLTFSLAAQHFHSARGQEPPTLPNLCEGLVL